MRTSYFVSVLIVGGLGSHCCFGQETAAAPPPAGIVFHATTNPVLLDVVVTDQGHAIHGLDHGRFHIFENGDEQPIASFDEHGPAAELGAVAQPALQPPNVYSNIPTHPSTSAVNVLLLDALNTPKPEQDNKYGQVAEHVASIPPGTSMAVFALYSKLELIQGFTTDATLLDDVHEKSGARWVVAAGCEIVRGTPEENLRAPATFAQIH